MTGALAQIGRLFGMALFFYWTEGDEYAEETVRVQRLAESPYRRHGMRKVSFGWLIHCFLSLRGTKQSSLSACQMAEEDRRALLAMTRRELGARIVCFQGGFSVLGENSIT